MRGVVFVCLVLCCLCVYCYDIVRDNGTKKFLERQLIKIKNFFKEIVDYLRKISPVWDELEKGDREHVI